MASSKFQDGSESDTFNLVRVRLRSFKRYLKMEDFPQPVGIPMVSQIITGSIQAVPVIVTSECETKNETRIISPLRTADEETLNALPTCSHPCNYKIKNLVNKYFVYTT